MNDLTVYEPPKKNRYPTVPWAYKIWAQFTEQDKIGVAEHLSKMDEDKRETYEKYLHSWCGKPKPIIP